MNEHRSAKEITNYLYQQAKNELTNILSYWKKNMTDRHYGGFYARRDGHNRLDQTAPKGVVLNARILWTFSATAKANGNQQSIALAKRAFKYMLDYFRDEVNGGVYWSVDRNGDKLDGKKQTYAQAFALYGYAAYFEATGNQTARNEAIAMFRSIETYCYDKANGGYTEALDENWTPLPDQRLSDKDANEPKSMNTHLHLLEAYTSLYRIWPDELLKQRIFELLRIFHDKIICKRAGHLNLFFSMDWEPRSTNKSFGHDVEAAWLLYEAARVLEDQNLITETQEISIRLTEAAKQGLDTDGGLWHEAAPDDTNFILEKHWWPQAEALVGFCNAWQLTGNEIWLKRADQTWTFIQEKLLDKDKGEWFWGIDAQNKVLRNEDKAGFWKCPYHNGRACLELIARLAPDPVI